MTEKPDLLFYDNEGQIEIEPTNYRGRAFLDAYSHACEHSHLTWRADDDTEIEGIELLDARQFERFQRQASAR
jgi:hypothetical protein